MDITKIHQLANALAQAEDKANIWGTFYFDSPAASAMFDKHYDEVEVLRYALNCEGYTIATNGDEPWILVKLDWEDVSETRSKLRYYDGETWMEKARSYVYRDRSLESEWRYMMECAEAEFCGGYY